MTQKEREWWVGHVSPLPAWMALVSGWKDGLVNLRDRFENLHVSLWRTKLEVTQDWPLKVPASLVTVKRDYPALWFWVDPSPLQTSTCEMALSVL